MVGATSSEGFQVVKLYMVDEQKITLDGYAFNRRQDKIISSITEMQCLVDVGLCQPCGYE